MGDCSPREQRTTAVKCKGVKMEVLMKGEKSYVFHQPWRPGQRRRHRCWLRRSLCDHRAYCPASHRGWLPPTYRPSRPPDGKFGASLTTLACCDTRPQCSCCVLRCGCVGKSEICLVFCLSFAEPHPRVPDIRGAAKPRVRSRGRGLRSGAGGRLGGGSGGGGGLDILDRVHR